MITIPLPHNSLTPEQEQWLAKNVGPRMHYLHNSIGGQGWIAKRSYQPGPEGRGSYWSLTFEDDRFATFFRIKFSA